jgi:hypothetical protein
MAREQELDMIAGVYTDADFTPAGQGKARRNRAMGDLLPAQAAEAATRNVVAIVSGTEVTILEPTGSLGLALMAIKAEREAKGI